MFKSIIILCCFMLLVSYAFAQDSTNALSERQLNTYTASVKKKAQKFTDGIERRSSKTLNRLAKKESRLKAFVTRINPDLGKRLFSHSIDSLSSLKNRINNRMKIPALSGSKNYFSYMDTLRQSVSYMQSNRNIGDSLGLKDLDVVVDDAQSTLERVEATQEYINQRYQELQDHLKNIPGMDRKLKGFNDEIGAYSRNLQEYKEVFSQPDKIEKLVMESVRKIPAFNDFMKQNSVLASLFPFNGSSGSSGTGNIPVVNGIPSRSAIQSSLPATSSNMDLAKTIQQQLTEVNPKIEAKKNKSSESDVRHPLKLKYGTDMQFAKATNYFPVTGDLALKAGCEFSERSTAVIGVAYKFGLGSGWKDIVFSHQGIGLRSYIDLKIKKSIYIQGGPEWNYNHTFKKVDELKNYPAWQTSFLVGVSRKYQVSKKIKGNFQMLYDFLHNKHIPNTQPLIFRFGYELK